MFKHSTSIFILLAIFITQACNAPAKKQDTRTVLINAAFEKTIDGKKTKLYLLRNKNGMQAAITNYGGRLVSLLVPGTDSLVDVVVGFDSVEGYEKSTEPYFGATIGRYGNRIAKGKFNLEGKEFQLSINNGPNTLHGGKNGFQYKVWDALQPNDSTLVLSYLSKDGEEGFPGNLQVKVTYSLTSNNEFRCAYEATTDKTTFVNLTNHAFFNLNGSGSIENHVLQVDADSYTPVDSTLIPTGKVEAVAGTPFDFRQPKAIGKEIHTKNEQLQFGKGYDHNFVLNGTGMRKVAQVTGDRTGITMEVLTSEPGLQFYSGNFMQSKNRLRTGQDEFRTAFCLETQHFPDSPNEPLFPSTLLKPGENYHTVSAYRFIVSK